MADPLVKFTQADKIALMMVVHLNIGKSTNVLSRISGPVAFGTMARRI